jgi:hypothetical protein
MRFLLPFIGRKTNAPLINHAREELKLKQERRWEIEGQVETFQAGQEKARGSPTRPGCHH